MKTNKHTAITFNSFLLSPFLSIPFLIIQLWKKNDTGVSLIVSMLIGILSFRFIPSFSNDKVRYIERSELFTNYSFADLLVYFKAVDRPDYIFDAINFLFAKANIEVKYFFFMITFVSIFLTLTVVKKILTNTTKNNFKYNNFTFFLIFFSFSVVNVLSGMRFFFAGSIFLWFIYYLYFEKVYLKSSLIAFLAISTHFSYSLLLVATILAFLNPKFRYSKYLLAISFVFFILPTGFTSNLLATLSLPSSYTGKIDTYTLSDIEYTANAIILSNIRNLWYFCACAFILFYNRLRNDRFYILLAFLIILVNFTFSIPVVFNRYITYLKIVFCIYLIHIYINYKINKYIILGFLALFIIGWYTDILILRYNFDKSYSLDTMWSIYHIILGNGELYNYLS